jgi:hypothetical protein
VIDPTNLGWLNLRLSKYLSKYFTWQLTLNITGKIKLHSEAAKLCFVRVHVFVRHFISKILSEIQQFCSDGSRNVNNLIVDSIELEAISEKLIKEKIREYLAFP